MCMYVYVRTTHVYVCVCEDYTCMYVYVCEDYTCVCMCM